MLLLTPLQSCFCCIYRLPLPIPWWWGTISRASLQSSRRSLVGSNIMNKNTTFTTETWLLLGLMHSIPGVLRLEKGRLTLRLKGPGTLSKKRLAKLEQELGVPGLAAQLAANQWCVALQIPLTSIERVAFPAWYFSAGLHLRTNGKRFRLSFIQPNNAGSTSASLPGGSIALIEDIREARRAGKRWKELLKKTHSDSPA